MVEFSFALNLLTVFNFQPRLMFSRFFSCSFSKLAYFFPAPGKYKEDFENAKQIERFYVLCLHFQSSVKIH